MNQKHFFTLVAILIFPLLNGLSYGQNPDDMLKPQKTETPQEDAPKKTEPESAQEKSSEKAANDQLPEAIELKKGMYGAPLGASVEEVLKWCEIRKIEMGNLRKKDFLGSAEAFLHHSNVKTGLKDDLSNLAEVEAELKQIQQARKKDPFFQQAAERYLSTLKFGYNPTFEFNGEVHFLFSVFGGFAVPSGDETEICADKKITKNAYRLLLAPSDEIKKDGVVGLSVFFFKDADGRFKSYAATAIFASRRVEEMRKSWATITDTLTEKYGKPHAESWGGGGNKVFNDIRNEILHMVGAFVTNTSVVVSFPDNAIPAFDEVTGVSLWKRNILVAGNFDKLGDGVRNISDPFFLMYYDPQVAKELFQAHTTVLEEFKKELQSRKQRAKEKRTDDF